jgi:hypothetical protein
MPEDPPSDSSPAKEAPSTTNVSGGVAVSSNTTNIGRDVVGRDKTEITNVYITLDEAFADASAASATVGTGLLALRELMQRSSQARDALITLREGFRDASAQVAKLGNYKDLHDLLHQLEFSCYNGLRREVIPRFPDDEAAAIALDQYVLDMDLIVNRLRQVLTRPSAPQEALGWIKDVASSRDELREASETRDAKILKEACSQVRRVLALQPTRINALLTQAADELRLHQLSLDLMVASNRLAAMRLEPDQMSRFRLGVEALGRLDQGLMTLIGAHHRWQDLDNLLRFLDSQLEMDLADLQWSWEDVQSKVEPLCSSIMEDWVIELSKAGANLQMALSSDVPVRVKRCFRNYYAQVSQRFFMIDRDLKSLCDDMQQIGEPLAAVMEMMV